MKKKILLVSSDDLRRDVLELILHQLDKDIELVWAENKEEARKVVMMTDEEFHLVVGIDD